MDENELRGFSGILIVRGLVKMRATAGLESAASAKTRRSPDDLIGDPIADPVS